MAQQAIDVDLLEQELAERIIAIQKHKKRMIVSICGAADLGKSYLASRMVNVLNQKSISSAHLNLDAFLMDRKERKEKGRSGYDKEAHDLTAIKSSLKQWQQNKMIKYRAYNHQSGTKDKNYSSLNPSAILLIEGLFAMEETLLPYIDYTIFIYTSDENLKVIRQQADLVKRGYTKAYSNKIYENEFRLYKKNIAAFKTMADCKIKLCHQWQYQIEES